MKPNWQGFSAHPASWWVLSFAVVVLCTAVSKFWWLFGVAAIVVFIALAMGRLTNSGDLAAKLWESALSSATGRFCVSNSSAFSGDF
jgi:hypothetical protein